MALRMNDLDLVNPVVTDTKVQMGLTLTPQETALAGRAALHGLVEAYRQDACSERGEAPLADITLPLPSAPAPQPVPVTVAVAMAEPAAAPVPPPAPASPLLTESLVDARRRRSQAQGDSKTLRDMDLAVRLFTELVDDMPLGTMRWPDVAHFRDQALALPKWHGKGIWDNMSAPQAIRLADAIDERDEGLVTELLGAVKAEQAMQLRPVERLSKKTINKHLSSLKYIVTPWCDRNTESKHTPFDGEFIPKSEVKKDVRLLRVALSDEDVRQLIGSPRFTGHSDDPLRALAGPNLIKDGGYWVPLIGIHSGMRLEEILQLQPADIETLMGVPVFTIGNRADVKLKNDYSRRRVPIHPALIRLGLLDYAAAMRGAGEQQLFPELERSGPDGRFGYSYSKDFTVYRRAIGFYRPGADFHALRHSLATHLYNHGVDTSIVAAILGHAQVGVTAGVYLSGFKIHKLAEALAMVDFGIEALLAGAG